MKIIVGLGNYGEEYKTTRHNAGFMTIDSIAKQYEFSNFHLEKKFDAEVSEGIIANQKCILVKPQTYMNRSGEALQKVMNFYKIDIADIIAIHDDLDIKLGEYKVAFDRSSAGHKGVQSIIDTLSSKAFKRIRIGIKTENKETPTEKFVLERFSLEEENEICEIINKIVLEIEKELI